MNKKEFLATFDLPAETPKPFLQKGEWAIHEVLPIILEGKKATVKIATFSVSETSIRTLLNCAEQNQISTLKLLIDNTVKQSRLQLLLFAKQITPEIATDATHAKILLIDFEGGDRFGIVGSANLNYNLRWEAGFYFTAGSTYDYFDTAFENAYNEGIKMELIE